ncbi:MAG TPA: M56 family metallopeptidase [Chitinophagaceae bacterium]|nr:M56 family metallopeptidase [Chitinophagaceae bacterium]
MPEIVYYLLKFAISLAVVYLFYHLILRRLTFYNWNRWYLMGYTLLSFFFAAINITPLLQQNQLDKDRTILMIPTLREQVQQYTTLSDQEPSTTSTWSRWDWTLLILGIGVSILLLQFCIRYLSYLNMRRKAALISDNGMRLYRVEGDIIPFSFGRSIFINPNLHDSRELQEIIRHEFVHVRQRHSIDIIWTELLCVFSWYNPFSWMIRKAVRQNLEFIADNKVLENGIDKKQYQYLLVKVIGNNQFSIAQKFNFSSLKKRIAMMNKMKSAGLHLVKFLFILPLAVVMLVAFRNKTADPSSALWSPFANLDNAVLVNSHPAYCDSTPVTDKNKLARVSNNFEITDKKAVITLKDGTVEKYDLTNPEDKKKFEDNYGRIFHLKGGTGAGTIFAIGDGNGIGIGTSNSNSNSNSNSSSNSNTNTNTNTNSISKSEGNGFGSNGEGDEEDHHVVICQVTCCNKAVATTVTTEPVVVTGVALTTTPSVAVNPICQKIKGESLTSVNPVTLIRTSVVNGVSLTEPVTEISPVAESHVSVIGRHGLLNTGKEEILVTISRYTTKDELETFKTQMKEKGFELNYTEIVYNDSGKLVKIRGTLKTRDNDGSFSATDFSKVILSIVKDGDRSMFKVDIKESKGVI